MEETDDEMKSISLSYLKELKGKHSLQENMH